MSNSYQKLPKRFPRNISFAVFFLTFLFYKFYPVGWQVLERSPLFLGVIVIGFPLVMLLSSIAFIFCKKTVMFVAVKIMTAFYAAFAIIICLSYESDGSLGDIFAMLLLMKIVCVLLIALTVLGNKNYRHKAQPSGLLTQWLFRDTLVAILAGWILGLWVWSLTLPATVISSAEEIALDSPYCIEANGTAVRNLLDLTAPSMYARRENGYAFNFHGLLKVGLTDSRYYNWSYRQNAFVELSPYTVAAMHLATSARCKPALRFSRNLPLLFMSKDE